MFSVSSQDCLESVEPLPQPSDRTSHGHLHSLVSLGPVRRMNNRSLYKPMEGEALLLLFPLQRFFAQLFLLQENQHIFNNFLN